MRAHGRTDGNQTAIVAALRKAGASVRITSMVGDGWADVVVGYCGIDQQVEIKTPGGDLTPAQRKHHREWRDRGRPVVVVESVADALDLIRAMRAEAWRRHV